MGRSMKQSRERLAISKSGYTLSFNARIRKGKIKGWMDDRCRIWWIQFVRSKMRSRCWRKMSGASRILYQRNSSVNPYLFLLWSLHPRGLGHGGKRINDAVMVFEGRMKRGGVRGVELKKEHEECWHEMFLTRIDVLRCVKCAGKLFLWIMCSRFSGFQPFNWYIWFYSLHFVIFVCVQYIFIFS